MVEITYDVFFESLNNSGISNTISPLLSLVQVQAIMKYLAMAGLHWYILSDSPRFYIRSKNMTYEIQKYVSGVPGVYLGVNHPMVNLIVIW